MPGIDEFSRTLIEEAKRFCEKAGAEEDPEGKSAFLHAALLLCMSALEANVNGIAQDFLVRTDLTPPEISILTEKEYRLEEGEFKVTGNLKIYRIEDRIQFLFRKFSGSPIDRQSPWWGQLKTSIKLRNELVHPKNSPSLTEADIKAALESVIQALDAMYQAIYHTSYPVSRRGLQSVMKF